MTHPSPKRNIVPKAVLMRSGIISLTTARPVNTAQPRTIVNSAIPMTNVFNKAHSTVRRPFNNKTATKNSISNQRVNIVRDNKVNTARPKAVVNTIKGNQVNTARPKAVVNAAKGYMGNDVKASACWVWRPKQKVIDHVFKHNSASMRFKRFDYIDTQGRSKEHVLPILLTLKKLIEDMLPLEVTLKEGKSQAELTDESHVLLKVPRKNNMYSVDLKNIVPKGGLTCLFAKATSDESELWHRRLGHINFKTMNKLVKGNLAEAVNTACYVQNRVLVTKPHNKTPYEFFLGRKPALGFTRPFRCPVTILNTIDHLGKFDGKADEGFFIGYSINRSGPNWVFDIDALTKLMNYKPVVAGNQSNGNAGDDEKNVTEEPGEEGGDSIKDSEINDQEKEDNVNSTDTVNAASTNEVNVVGAKTSIKLPDDLNMPELEDIVYSDDDEDVGAEANMNNLDAFMLSEEGVDYDEFFASVARIEAIRFEDPDFPLTGVYKVEKAIMGTASLDILELGMKLDKGDILLVQVYVDDIIFGSTKKSLCTEFENMMHKKFQMSSMGELTFFLGLQVKQKEDEIFISQDKYVTEILKNFGFTDIKTTSTPMETQKLLLKDEDGEEVDVYLYRSMIGSLMYLTSSRPDIMFAVCACARYQVNLKVSHLYVVKRIISDYARASLDRKFTTRGCLFLRCRLISWQCKK
ncbi:uncharacterized mitochondrial protein-like protein [Tanacetum coccineum]